MGVLTIKMGVSLTLPLSNTSIIQAKPKDKPYKLSDSFGLYLYIRPSGSKTWRLKYRFDGKERVLTIGRYSKNEKAGYTLAEARIARDEAKKLLANGIDPSLEKQRKILETRKLQSNTFEKVARNWWKAREGGWTSNHSKAVIHTLEQNVFPDLGQFPVSEITPQHVLKVIRKIEKRGALEMASKVLQRINAIFRFSIIELGTQNNPASELREALKTPEVRHHPSLNAKELPEFLKKLEEYDGHLQTKLAAKLIILTFLRSWELRGAEWEEIDWTKKRWDIPKERMKGKKGKKREHIVPLSEQAIQKLKELKTLNGHQNLIFPSQKNPNQPISENTILYAFYRIGYHSRATPHGFRTTASTILNENGFNPDAIERQLSHVPENKIRGTYNKALYLPERKRIMQWWADYLDNLENSTNVASRSFGHIK